MEYQCHPGTAPRNAWPPVQFTWDAREFCAAVEKGRWDDAWKTLRRTMPFPGILGRICHAPCEDKCKRGQAGDPVRIGAMEKSLRLASGAAAEDHALSLQRQKSPGGWKRAERAHGRLGSGPQGRQDRHSRGRLQYWRKVVGIHDRRIEPGNNQGRNSAVEQARDNH